MCRVLLRQAKIKLMVCLVHLDDNSLRARACLKGIAVHDIRAKDGAVAGRLYSFDVARKAFFYLQDFGTRHGTIHPAIHNG